MANKAAKGNGSAGGVLGALAIVGAFASFAEPYVDKIVEELKKRAEERKDWIPIPELCSRNNPKKLDDAVAILKILNLKYVCLPINIEKSNAKYRDCFDMQVVFFEPKNKKLLNPKTESIQLYYVTSEIIKESQRLFDESEKHKAKIKNERYEKKVEQKQKAQNQLVNTINIISKKNSNSNINIGEDEDINNMNKENIHE